MSCPNSREYTKLLVLRVSDVDARERVVRYTGPPEFPSLSGTREMPPAAAETLEPTPVGGMQQ